MSIYCCYNKCTQSSNEENYNLFNDPGLLTSEDFKPKAIKTLLLGNDYMCFSVVQFKSLYYLMSVFLNKVSFSSLLLWLSIKITKV